MQMIEHFLEMLGIIVTDVDDSGEGNKISHQDSRVLSPRTAGEGRAEYRLRCSHCHATLPQGQAPFQKRDIIILCQFLAFDKIRTENLPSAPQALQDVPTVSAGQATCGTRSGNLLVRLSNGDSLDCDIREENQSEKVPHSRVPHVADGFHSEFVQDPSDANVEGLGESRPFQRLSRLYGVQTSLTKREKIGRIYLTTSGRRKCMRIGESFVEVHHAEQFMALLERLDRAPALLCDQRIKSWKQDEFPHHVPFSEPTPP